MLPRRDYWECLLSLRMSFVLKDIRCTCGSRILDNFIAPYTATSVQKLIDAGVVILGKTNTDEFAMGSSTENSGYGATHNPWNIKHVPGGSSGGSAAAVAAHFTTLGLGTDTGGSIRQPASFCGLTGLKVTYGRISRYGLVAYGSSLDTVGALARNVTDLAVAIELMAGHDPLDATSSDKPMLNVDLKVSIDIKALRIGIPKEYFIAGIAARGQPSCAGCNPYPRNIGGRNYRSQPATHRRSPACLLFDRPGRGIRQSCPL